MSRYRLLVMAGPDRGTALTLPRDGEVLIGRAEECALRLADPSVSRRQCRLFIDGETHRLEDAGSKWGLLINGQPKKVANLQLGDVFLIGDTEIRFEQIAPTGAPAPPAERPPSPPRPKNNAPREPALPVIRDLGALVGETFVRYRIGGIEARTSSGVVFRSLDLRSNERIALKIFHPGFFTDEANTQRFLRAMRTVLPMQHPNLVRLHAAGRSRGVCFTASEFIEGESARQMIHRIGIAGMLDWKNVWRIGVQIARALRFAEERGIVHRNIQPGNILVRASDRCALLGDLMLARAIDESGDQKITKRGEVIGEMAYLSPEQAIGETQFDSRVDIYGLGATLYALLTGRPPFEGSPRELIDQIRRVPPTPITRHHLAVPAGFEGLILRMLAKRPDDRFSSAAILVRDLETLGRYQGLE